MLRAWVSEFSSFMVLPMPMPLIVETLLNAMDQLCTVTRAVNGAISLVLVILQMRYQKQLQRWRDYRNLFSFLGFVALFLAVLYTQRQADTAFKVYSTLSDVLVPSDNVMGSTDDVYSWLTGVLTVCELCVKSSIALQHESLNAGGLDRPCLR